MRIASSSILASIALLRPIVVCADDIHLGMIKQCNGFGGDIRISSATCDYCNWGDEATLSGTVSAASCSDICIVVTAYAPLGIGEHYEIFREENYDCSDFSASYKLPNDIPAALKNIASGYVHVEFFENGCSEEGGATRVGCSNLPLTAVPTAVRVTGAVAAVGAVGMAGAAVLNCVKAKGAGAASGGVSSAGGDFSRMKGSVV